MRVNENNQEIKSCAPRLNGFVNNNPIVALVLGILLVAAAGAMAYVSYRGYQYFMKYRSTLGILSAAAPGISVMLGVPGIMLIVAVAKHKEPKKITANLEQ